MRDCESGTYDVVGIGFGPANLSLAIALQERPEALTSVFFERQGALGWHRGMLLPSAKMQVSFLKDLATFRNPLSRFSFVSYLHETGRLVRFVNKQDFFPSRQEFHDYLEWAEAKLAQRVAYSSVVKAIRLGDASRTGSVEHLRVEVADQATGASQLVTTRNVVISTGLTPRMPPGITRDNRVWHSSEFLHAFREFDHRSLKRVAVVGAGESAAEIVQYLHGTLPDANIWAIMSSYGYSIADNTPFANQIFDPAAVDDYYDGSQRAKDAIWTNHKNTNYSVVDDEVIKDLYQRAYEDDVNQRRRLNFVNLTRVVDAKQVADEVRVTVHSLASNESYEFGVDVLICATGYDPMEAAEVLGDLKEHCVEDESGRYRVDRDYRIVTKPGIQCGIYLQGGTEHTHGLSSSLLSNIAVRSGEIADSIAAGAGLRAPDEISPDEIVAADLQRS